MSLLRISCVVSVTAIVATAHMAGADLQDAVVPSAKQEQGSRRGRGCAGLHYGIASFGEAATHEWIALQAYELFRARLPSEMSSYLKDRQWTEPYTDYDWCELVDAGMDPTTGGYVLEGAEEEDLYNGVSGPGYWVGTWSGSSLIGVPCAIAAANIFNNHFWDADGEGWNTGYPNPLNGYAPSKCSLHKALHYWRNGVLPNYPSNKSLAYYYLGRIAHLLADASVPAHVHNDGHGSWLVGEDSYEDYFRGKYAELGRWFYDVHVAAYLGGLAPINYKTLPVRCPLETETTFEGWMADLFYNMAQQAQHFDSNGVDGNDSNSLDGTGTDVFGLAADRGSRRAGGMSDVEVEEIVAVMLPKAVAYTAALYELFWEATSQQRPSEFTVVAESPLFVLDTRPFDWPHVTGPFQVAVESHFFVLNTSRLGVGSVTDSALFTINTRGGIRGSLAGRVIGDGVTVQGAVLELAPGTMRAVTGSDGRFLLDGVLSGTGYQLRIAASGFESATVSGVRVSAGLTDLGDIWMTALSGELRLADLSPPVNPVVSSVPLGGAAYRYYRLLAGSGQSAGGTAVALRRQDGSAITQVETGEHDWAGAVPGIADADGIVRVVVPAWAVGTRVGDTQQFEVLVGGKPVATFQATLVDKDYDLVWRHRVGGGVSGKIKVFRVTGKGAYEAEVRHQMAGGMVERETITRTRQAELRGGVEIGAGVKIVAGTKAKVGAGGFLAVNAHKTLHFDDPASTDPGENLVKMYLALGDPLSLAPGPGKALYDFVGEVVEPPLLGSQLDNAGAELLLGGYAEGELSAGFKAGRQARVGAIAELSAEAAALLGCEEQYRVEDDAWSGRKALKVQTLGFVRRGEIDVSAGVSIGPSKKAAGFGVDLVSASGESAFRAGLVRDLNSGRNLRIQVEQEATLSGRVLDALVGWALYLAPNAANELSLVLNEKLEFDLPDSGAFSRVSVVAPVWNLVNGLGEGGIVRADQPAALAAGLVQSALNDGVPLKYERSIYGAKALSVEPEIDLDAVIAGLGVSFEGAMERGAELVTERGRIWRMRRMGLESGGVFSKDLLPGENIFKLEARWALNAAGPIGWFLNEVYTKIKEAGETVIEAGGAVIRFGEGVIEGGIDVISRWFRAEGGGGVALHGPLPEDGWLPPPGATNYVYGVSGFFSFQSKGAMSGAAMLSLPYSEAEVVGLNPVELSIYRLAEGTNKWEWVGGVVDTNAHTVTASVTNLGTFALAPPLPTGNLLLVPAGDSMSADGSSVMTFTVTNLVLNTGAAAAQPWLFTVSANGGQVVEPDIRADTAGIQVGGANAVLRFSVRAPLGGNRIRIEVASLAGDAWGEYELPLVDDTPPAPPSGLRVSAGQSRVFVTWLGNSEPDVARYRVYYRAGKAGPPWDGTAAVEGTSSPVSTVSTNAVLRGLAIDTDYYIAVAAVDTTGNESSLGVAAPVRTTEGPPLPPSNVMLRIEVDATAHVAWTASEDDGFNDRDVVRYEIWRAVLPGGQFAKAGELPSGSEVYLEPAPAVDASHFLRYGVRAVDSHNLVSDLALSNRLMADGRSVDNDGDGMPDDWESRYGLNPLDPTDADGDLDGDGVSNRDEYLAGSEPGEMPHPRFEGTRLTPDGRLELTVRGLSTRDCVLQASENLVEWVDVATISAGDEPVLWVEDMGGTGSMRFYRVIAR